MKNLKLLSLGMLAVCVMVFALSSCDSEESDGVQGGFSDAKIKTLSLLYTVTDEGGDVVFPASGGEIVFTVTCETGWSAENRSDGIFSTEIDMEASTLTLTAWPSRLEEDLTGELVFTAEPSGDVFAIVSIVQEAYVPPYISVGSSEWNAPAKGALSADIAVSSNVEWGAVSDGEWLKAEKVSGGIRLTAEESESTEVRDATVTLTYNDGEVDLSDSISVTQDALAYLNVSAEAEEFSLAWDGEGEETFSVESNYEWSMSYDGDWMKIVKDGSSVTVEYDKNSGFASRRCTITFTAGDGAENVASVTIVFTQGCEPLILVYTLTEETGLSITLPLYTSYNCTVNWGDDSDIETVSGTTTSPGHEYDSVGEYEVVVSGTVTRLYCSVGYSSSNPCTTLTAVRQWGKTGLTSLSKAFQYCTALAALPEGGAGDSFKNVTTVGSAFQGCTGLTSVAENLFGECPGCTDISSVFSGCSGLTSVPGELFSGFTGKVTTASAVFQNCSLTSIPAGIFSADGFKSVTEFSNVFRACPITEIPEGLFDNCTAATSFLNSFYRCAKLTAIPVGLFDNCKEANVFIGTFSRSNDDENVSLSGESPYTEVEIDGETKKIHLYERSEENGFVSHADPASVGSSYTKVGCFTHCDGLADYETMPDDWK